MIPNLEVKPLPYTALKASLRISSSSMKNANWDYVDSVIERYDLVNRRRQMRKAA